MEEFYPIVVSAILWGEKWKSKKKIIFYCDNEATRVDLKCSTHYEINEALIMVCCIWEL